MGTAQINDFIVKLQHNGINGVVIEDILHYQTTAGIFVKTEEVDRDADDSPDSSLVYDSDGDVVTDRNEIIKRKIWKMEENNEIPMYPEWFPDKSMFPENKMKKKEKKIDWRNDPNWKTNHNFGFGNHKQKEERVWIEPIEPDQINWNAHRDGHDDAKKKKKTVGGMMKSLFGKKKKSETKEEEEALQWDGTVPETAPGWTPDVEDIRHKKKKKSIKKRKKKSKKGPNHWRTTTYSASDAYHE